MKLIEREYYINRIIDVIDTPDIKIITGIRRCGKSKLMDRAIKHIDLLGYEKNIIRINLNLKKYYELWNSENLYEYIDGNYEPDKVNYLFIDEVQLCKNFELTINSLYEENRFNIFLTGSNAFLLSSDLATLFGGRVFDLKLYPFSFKEYLEYFPNEDVSRAFDEYVVKGGMAGSYLYKNNDDRNQYLRGIVNSTITKDIITKYKIENESLLNMIIEFLIDNIGNRTSIRNIAAVLSSSTYKTNDKTVGSYLDYLCRSFLFYPVSRYDIRGKKYLESEKKYYLSDIAFRYAVIGTRYHDYGRIYENIVALELLRRGYEVYVGQLYQKEIDFVAIKNGEKTYIQVSDDISNESTFKREVDPLMKIKDAFPKIILARTKHSESQYEGIRIIDISDWLSL